MLLVFCIFRDFLTLDHALDDFIVPPLIQPLLHTLMPSPSVVGDMTIGFIDPNDQADIKPLPEFMGLSTFVDRVHVLFKPASALLFFGQSQVNVPSTSRTKPVDVKAWVRKVKHAYLQTIEMLRNRLSHGDTKCSASSSSKSCRPRRVASCERNFLSIFLLNTVETIGNIGSAAITCLKVMVLMTLGEPMCRCLKRGFFVALWDADIDGLAVSLIVLQSTIWLGCLFCNRRMVYLKDLLPGLQPPLPHNAEMAWSTFLNMIMCSYLGRLFLHWCGLVPSWQLPLSFVLGGGNASSCVTFHVMLSLWSCGLLTFLHRVYYFVEEDFGNWRWERIEIRDQAMTDIF